MALPCIAPPLSRPWPRLQSAEWLRLGTFGYGILPRRLLSNADFSQLGSQQWCCKVIECDNHYINIWCTFGNACQLISLTVVASFFQAEVQSDIQLWVESWCVGGEGSHWMHIAAEAVAMLLPKVDEKSLKSSLAKALEAGLTGPRDAVNVFSCLGLQFWKLQMIMKP